MTFVSRIQLQFRSGYTNGDHLTRSTGCQGAINETGGRLISVFGVGEWGGGGGRLRGNCRPVRAGDVFQWIFNEQIIGALHQSSTLPQIPEETGRERTAEISGFQRDGAPARSVINHRADGENEEALSRVPPPPRDAAPPPSRGPPVTWNCSPAPLNSRNGH